MPRPNFASTTEFRSAPIQADVFAEAARPSASVVSWGAILAGAAAAAALSLILLILGTGLGLSMVSPWSNAGIGAATFGVTTILWVTLTQLLASGMGGYIAGRLRANWFGTQSDEIFFRDTAHGFLAWAIATLATAALLTGVIGTMVGGGVQAGATLAGGAAVASAANKREADSSGPLGYFVDSLFRKEMDLTAPGAAAPATLPGWTDATDTATLAEITRIFAQSMRSGPLPVEDVRYVGERVAQRAGLSQTQAEQRVVNTYARVQTTLRELEVSAKQAADKARKASSYTALWLFISLLVGAFFASLAAVFGGRQRDL